MAAPGTQANYLLQMLASGQVKRIDSSVFIGTSPSETTLPSRIDAGALRLLGEIQGRIYPIALRGKCQAGKSTTLNRVAKISNIPLEKPLEEAKDFGGSTTEGIWLMIITFKNKDTLLLFDVQGTDRGGDEVTHKLIALTDHICTKVVDVFRMPLEGFSNDYINSLFCLAKARESIRNLMPTSDKSILWTSCVLPKRSPLNKKEFCKTTQEYQMALMKSAVGERKFQGEKVEAYAAATPIITTGKPPDEILFKISELQNDNEFIATQVMPALKKILENCQPFTFNSHIINDGKSFVQYLENVFNNIKESVIDLPFCALPMIRNIAITLLKEKKLSITRQIDQQVSSVSRTISQISETLIPKLRQLQSNCVAEFEQELANLQREHWQDQLIELNEFINNKIQKIIDQFKPQVLDHILKQEFSKLNSLCGLGSQLSTLEQGLQAEANSIQSRMEQTPFLRGNFNSVDKQCVGRALHNHKLQLCHVQEKVENDWQRRVEDFRKQIYSTDPDGVDVVINQMIREHNEYAEREFSKFNVTWKHFFDVNTKKEELKKDNSERSKTVASKCKDDCIEEFNRKTGMIMGHYNNPSEMYGNLVKELEICLRNYYDKLPWPLNDKTVGEVDNELHKIFDRVIQNIFTPEVKQRLKRERIEQMELMSKLRLNENESLLWVYCVYCKRVFAGRTRGCVNVTCCHFNTIRGTKNSDHGCGQTFQWEKAQPVQMSSLPQEFWHAAIETDERNGSIESILSIKKDEVRRLYSANKKKICSPYGSQ